MNINRDYLIINDVKKSNVTLNNGGMFFYITDKNTQNMFVNLVINVSDNELIQKYANIENAEDYTLTMNIIKPDNTCKIVEGKLRDKEKAIYEFDLKEDCVDKVGIYTCELLTKCTINGHEEITTSNKITYKVNSSIFNDLDDIVEAPEYPVVIQLFDKLSDIEQYEEDRRANELARQLAEEQRQAKHNELVADMTNSIQAMDNKVVEVENRITAKEQAVNTLIVDTKADINEYKTAKDQEIDNYKAAKDTEIDEAIANQDNKIDTAISEQNDRITVVENNDVAQDNRLDVLENKDVLHESRLDAIEVKNQQQDNRLDIVENKNQQQDNRLDVVEAKNVEQDNRLNDIEAIDVAQNSRLDAIEVKNQQQDDRLLDIEKVNKRQDMNLKCLFAESKNNMIDITEEGNSIYLQNSTTGYTLIDEIKGNTLVNCNKEPNKELILNGNINTSGDNTVTITEGVDGGLVDVALEGNTLVNVSKTKDSTAITKAYTVENSGNHVALQDNIDGSCRPVIEGKTLVNIATCSKNTYDYLTYDGDWIIFNADGNSTYRINPVYPRNELIKADTTYTIIIDVSQNTLDSYLEFNWSGLDGVDNGTCMGLDINIDARATGRYIYVGNSKSDIVNQKYIISPRLIPSNSAGLIKFRTIILEGDYTDKPIPDYFTGLQSSFEDNLVTQEMVDSGEEIADNLGKYRVEYKVTGKNKFDGKTELGIYNFSDGVTIQNNNDYSRTVNYINVKGMDKIIISDNQPVYSYRVYLYDKDKNHIRNIVTGPNSSLDVSEASYIRVIYNNIIDKNTIQIEEGDTVTSYEPYKEYTKTLYLNSPLLEGDTIEEKDGGIYHVHRSELSAYTEGDEASLITDKVNTVHQLETPQYELIEQSNLVIPSYANGHLDFNTAIPVEKAEFKSFSEELTYLYANTQYIVQFVSDNAITADITLGGTQLLAQSIVVGLNRISITTPATLVDNKLIISGVGANISEVVVTDTDREFGYFEGMKSVGECEDLEVKSSNKNLCKKDLVYAGKYMSSSGQLVNNSEQVGSDFIQVVGGQSIMSNLSSNTYFKEFDINKKYIRTIPNSYTFTLSKHARYITFNFVSSDAWTWVKQNQVMIHYGNTLQPYTEGLSNTQQLTHEPLRGVGDYRDRYVLVDGKWYIEKKCREYTIPQNTVWTKTTMVSNNGKYTRYFFIMDNMITDQLNASNYVNFAISDLLPFGYPNSWGSCNRNEIQIINNSTEFYVQLDKTTIEEVASLMNGSKIIYRLDKPQYEPIDYNPLEVYSDVTHITTNSVIPTNITIKNHGYNCLLKPSTTYTISSNLGLNTVTTPAKLTEDCLRFMDADTSDVTTMRDVLVLEGDWTTKADLIPANFSGIESAFEQEYDIEKGKYKVNIKVANEDKTKENNITFYINEPLRGIGTAKDRVYVKDDKVAVERNCGSTTFDGSEDERWRYYQTGNATSIYIISQPSDSYTSASGNILCDRFLGYSGAYNINNAREGCVFDSNGNIYVQISNSKLSSLDLVGFRQWLQQNPITLVYRLAEPTYEEIEYNDTKLFIESFKNSTLSYNSNVPVQSKLYYSYSVPIVDTVAQTASISDEQDVMIIDLATQVAVMEMLLM